MEIMDMSGKALVVAPTVTGPGGNRFTMAIPSLAGGLYALQISRPGEVPLQCLFLVGR